MLVTHLRVEYFNPECCGKRCNPHPVGILRLIDAADGNGGAREFVAVPAFTKALHKCNVRLPQDLTKCEWVRV